MKWIYLAMVVASSVSVWFFGSLAWEAFMGKSANKSGDISLVNDGGEVVAESQVFATGNVEEGDSGSVLIENKRAGKTIFRGGKLKTGNVTGGQSGDVVIRSTGKIVLSTKGRR